MNVPSRTYVVTFTAPLVEHDDDRPDAWVVIAPSGLRCREPQPYWNWGSVSIDAHEPTQVHAHIVGPDTPKFAAWVRHHFGEPR